MEHIERMSTEEVEAMLRCVGAYMRRDAAAVREHRAKYHQAKAARERQTITVHGEAVV